MRFSVLMSVYKNDNPEHFEEALKSISANQEVRPSQVVIVKDGPVALQINEIVQDYLKKYPQIEFTIIENTINKGLAAALNIGISKCKYNWIARMDADDISTNDRFKKQIKYITDHPDVEVLGGAIQEFQNVPGDLNSERHVGKTTSEIKSMAKTRCPMNHVTVMYKKDILLKMGGYSENFGKLEDYKLWTDMIINKIKMANIDDVICYVRIGNGFFDRRSDKNEIHDWDMLQEYLFKHHLIGRYKVIINKIYIRFFIFTPKIFKVFAYKFLLRRKKTNDK